jgi:redox-sensing transcriptional repressor
VDLKVPPQVQVESVHLQDSLLKLSYNIHRYEREN